MTDELTDPLEPETPEQARRWNALFCAIHSPRGSRLRERAEWAFVRLSEKLQRKPKPRAPSFKKS